MTDMSDPYADAENAFRSGRIDRLDDARLRTHLLTLANDGPDLKRDLIRAAWVQHILVERHLDELDRKSARLLWIVSALALAVLASAVLQIASKSSRDPPPVQSQPRTPDAPTAPAVGSMSIVPPKDVEVGLDLHQHPDKTWSWRHVKGDTVRESTRRFANYSDAVNDALREGFEGGTLTTIRKQPAPASQ